MTIMNPSRCTGVALLLAAIGLAAPATASDAGGSRCARLRPTSAERIPLDEARQAMVAEALQDEYHGRSLYGRALEELGEVRPFVNVVPAEERHAALLEELLESRSLPVPPDRWGDADLPSWSSRQEACVAGVEFEVANVALYDRLLADEDLPEDVRQVFEHNRMASLEHHKPAFERCATGARGQGRGAGAARDGQDGTGGRHRCGRARAAGGCGGCGGSGPRCSGGCRHGSGERGGPSGEEPTAPAPAESGS
jgi:hypothetical protein